MMKLFLLFIALLTFVEANKLKGHTKNPKLLKQKETLVLNHENFDYALNKYDVLLVDFYAPWCPHCKNLAPEFDKAAKVLKQKGIRLGKVDCTNEHKLRNRFHINAYPSLRIFYKDRMFHYNGPRNADGIVHFMTKHLQQQQEEDQN